MIKSATTALAFAAWLFATGTGWAAAVRTPEQAADRVQSEGFALVSKTERADGFWDVWASKEGIPYVVRLDTESGSILAASPTQDDD